MTYTSIYTRWKQINRRTTKPKANGYNNYGGRGITMCQTWLESFTAFYQHVGDPPSPHHTIERINNNKGYCPSNVRWATYSDQGFNQRKRKSQFGLTGVRCTKDTYWSMITINGIRMYLGSFDTPEEAHSAYMEAKRKHVVSIKAVPTNNRRPKLRVSNL